MSEFATLQELRDCIRPNLVAKCNLTDQEFTDLLNIAAERIYVKTAQHGNLKEVDVIPLNNLITVSVSEYSTVFGFRVGKKNYNIVPVVDTWKNNRAGYNSFVDLGNSDSDITVREYRIPECFHDQNLTDYEFQMLAKRQYQKVQNDTDVVEIRSKASIEAAILSILHEREIDPDTAAKYWRIAVGEGDESDQEFRGPVTPTISFIDPCLETGKTNLI